MAFLKVSTQLRSAVPGVHAEELEQINEVVESAIDSNDILPLVRLVFEGRSELESPSSATSGQVATGDIVKACLENLAEEEDCAAAQICRGNTDTIAQSMDELDAMQFSASSLGQDIVGVNTDLQKAGEELLDKLKEVNEMQEIEDRLLATGQSLEWACSVLEQCAMVCQATEQHKLYQGLKILEQIKCNMLDTSSKLAGAKPLKSFFQKITNDLVMVIQRLANSDFNEWLVSARAEARQIGLQAIRRAAILRQHDERCAQERNTILEAIRNGSDLQNAVGLTVPSLGTIETLSETASRPTFQSMDVTAGPDHYTDDEHMDRMSVLSDAGRSTAVSVSGARSAVSIMSDHNNRTGMAMRGLHRCIHVHQCLGSLNQFREYYMQQRRLQMDSDLRPPTNFLEMYQSYLSQVTGFFIIEDNVQRMTEDLISQQDVDALWEMATATLKSVVDSAFEKMNSAAAMLLVKDFLLLVCSGLAKSGYPASNLKEILSSNTGKYHDLTNASVAKQVSKIWDDDDLELKRINSESAKTDFIKKLGLPCSLDGTDRRVPFETPFTQMVPHFLWLVQDYVRDSVAYLKGLINPGDVLSTATQNRDKMIKMLIDTIHSKLHDLSGDNFMLKECMQLVSNIWALTHGLIALDAWTITQVVHGSNGEINSGKSSGKSNSTGATVGGALYQLSMKSVQDAAEQAVVKLVATKIEEMLVEIKNCDWNPKQPPPAATSAVTEELMIYLQGVFDLSCTTMPRTSADTVMKCAMQVVGNFWMHILKGSEVPTFNDYGFQRALTDVSALEKFAARCPVVGLGRDLAQPREICEVIVSGKLQMASDPQKLKSNYPHIEVAVFVSVLDKYRDVGGTVSNFINQKMGVGQHKRKDVESVAKQLRDKMVISQEH